jgi:hypothetical protein
MDAFTGTPGWLAGWLAGRLAARTRARTRARARAKGQRLRAGSDRAQRGSGGHLAVFLLGRLPSAVCGEPEEPDERDGGAPMLAAGGDAAMRKSAVSGKQIHSTCGRLLHQSHLRPPRASRGAASKHRHAPARRGWPGFIWLVLELPLGLLARACGGDPPSGCYGVVTLGDIHLDASGRPAPWDLRRDGGLETKRLHEARVQPAKEGAAVQW